MFSKYLDLTKVNSLLEAVGFYIFMTILLVGFSSTVVHVIGMVGVTEMSSHFFGGGGIHTLIGSIFVLFISTLVVSGKGLGKDILSVVLVVLSVGLAYKVSILLGLIPVALLTMLKKG